MPEVIVLDTHIWFWYINGTWDRFPAKWVKHIQQSNIVVVSAISCFEIALAYKKGRLELNIPIQNWLIDSLSPSGIRLLPLTPEITCSAVNLSSIHKDPFDRLIISTAIEYGAKLASIDQQFSRYPELSNHLLKEN
jgi:PIN domain nuclease of toxin-antitoxin system